MSCENRVVLPVSLQVRRLPRGGHGHQGSNHHGGRHDSMCHLKQLLHEKPWQTAVAEPSRSALHRRLIPDASWLACAAHAPHSLPPLGASSRPGWRARKSRTGVCCLQPENPKRNTRDFLAAEVVMWRIVLAGIAAIVVARGDIFAQAGGGVPMAAGASSAGPVAHSCGAPATQPAGGRGQQPQPIFPPGSIRSNFPRCRSSAPGTTFPIRIRPALTGDSCPKGGSGD